MTRAATAWSRLGLAVAVAIAMTTGATAGAAATTPAQGCSWQRHSKTVVKHLRRHGHPRRVKQIKRWWTCDAHPTPLPPATALPVLPTPEAPPAEEPAPQVSHLGVKAVEYSYTLSRPEVAAGEVIVELNNQGEDPHNLKLQREGSEDPPLVVPEASAEEQTSARFTLAPGAYRLYCSLYNHEVKGMHATLVVGGG